MCVLCKFYGQHRFHSFELLNQAAGKYGVRLSEETSRLQELDKAVKVAIEELVMTEKNIVESARHCEERLERHFGELRSQLLAALERRETVLLALVDQEVEGLQEEVARQREELSLLRARVLGTMEEGGWVFWRAWCWWAAALITAWHGCLTTRVTCGSHPAICVHVSNMTLSCSSAS